MLRASRRATAVLIASTMLLALPAGNQAKAEPITIAIAIGIGASLVVAIGYDQFTANYLSISLGYATPQPDATLVWKQGRSNPAVAGDADSGPPGPSLSFGQAYTEVGYIYDTLDPISLSEGNYYNASRTYKNGDLKDSEIGGNPPPGGARATTIKVDISNLPLENEIKLDMHAGKAGSYDSVFGGGAEYVNGVWVPWDARSETDPTVSSYLNGTMPTSSGSDSPSYTVPSVYEMFSSDETNGTAFNWFPYFESAVLAAGTHDSGGKTYYNDFSFEVPLAASVDALGSWYVSNGVVARNEVFEPPALALFAIGILTWLCFLRCRRPGAIAVK